MNKMSSNKSSLCRKAMHTCWNFFQKLKELRTIFQKKISRLTGRKSSSFYKASIALVIKPDKDTKDAVEGYIFPHDHNSEIHNK